jgi:PAS domain S-box-containing protein
MVEQGPGQFDERVLVLAPTARDAATSQSVLEAAGVRCVICGSIEDVCREAERGAGAAVLTAEVTLADKDGRLAAWLKTQPPWSDFPLIVLTPPGAEASRLLRALAAVGHMTLMKRPVQVSALISTVQSALRDRRRQYAVRDLFVERQQAAEALREEHERYRITLASIGDAVIATDTEGRVTFLNAVAELLTGWEVDAARGRPLVEIFHIVNEATRRPVPNPALRALKEGVIVGLANHTILIARDGSERPLDDSAAPIRGARGDLVGAILVFRDITERKRADDQVRRAAEANAKFRAMFEQGTHFAGILTLDGTIVEANRLCLDACGFTRDEVIGKPFWECGWWNRSPELSEKVRSASLQAAGGQPFRAESNYFVADGGERVVDLAIAPVTDETGRILFVAATGTDITERKRAEGELKAGDRKKDEFIALLAHELRNPLAPLRNGLQVLRLAGGDANALARARGMMERQLGHMVRLIDDLLDISRISQNKMDLRRKPVLLTDVVGSAVETARPAIEAAGHGFTVSLPPEPVYLDADLTRLAQVFSNLLTNSAKYTDRGGRVWLTAERRDGEVVVSVRDTGIGIPAESLGNIFNMFSQVDRSIERSTGGLGIGLALVKGLVEMHGGTVTAASEGEGRGSTFAVTLPVVANQAVPKDLSADGGQKTARPKRRILVVDDNRDGADSLAMMLRLIGDEVRTAHDGIEAVEQAEAFRPELVLMDVGMPRLNGLDATRRDMVIIALTGWGQEGDKERSRGAGCDGHLVKPVDPSELQKLLEKRDG